MPNYFLIQDTSIAISKQNLSNIGTENCMFYKVWTLKTFSNNESLVVHHYHRSKRSGLLFVAAAVLQSLLGHDLDIRHRMKIINGVT